MVIAPSLTDYHHTMNRKKGWEQEMRKEGLILHLRAWLNLTLSTLLKLLDPVLIAAQVLACPHSTAEMLTTDAAVTPCVSSLVRFYDTWV